MTLSSSSTGPRHQDLGRLGTSVVLHTRERADERAIWFLGRAIYVRHEGKRPMAITWWLRHALPGGLVRFLRSCRSLSPGGLSGRCT